MHIAMELMQVTTRIRITCFVTLSTMLDCVLLEQRVKGAKTPLYFHASHERQRSFWSFFEAAAPFYKLFFSFFCFWVSCLLLCSQVHVRYTHRWHVTDAWTDWRHLWTKMHRIVWASKLFAFYLTDFWRLFAIVEEGNRKFYFSHVVHIFLPLSGLSCNHDYFASVLHLKTDSFINKVWFSITIFNFTIAKLFRLF